MITSKKLGIYIDGEKIADIDSYTHPPFPVTITNTFEGTTFEFEGIFKGERMPRKLKKRIKKEWTKWAAQSNEGH